MVLILLGALLIVSVMLFCLRRNRETGLIFLLCLALSVEWTGVLVYIAKKGGIAQDMQMLLFLVPKIRRSMQYMMVTLGHLGYYVALGRYLFPLVLMALALHYTVSSNYLRRRLTLAASVLPAVSLVIYYPAIFEALINRFHGALPVIVDISLAWTLIYVAAAIGIMLHEYFSISIRFWRRQFLNKLAMIFSLTVLYVLYCPQDPAQIYLFYRNEYMGMNQGLWYLSPALSVVNYIIVFAIVGICAVVGFWTLLTYMQDSLREDREEVAIQRKFDTAGTGVSVFVHSIKNQLLANRVLHKRIGVLLESDTPDLDKVREYQRALQQANETMLTRMEELYQAVKSKSILLQPTPLSDVVCAAAERFSRKYPQGLLSLDKFTGVWVLCDKTHLAEAVYNLLVNGWEAQVTANRMDTPVCLMCHQERMWTVLEVKDCGVGLTGSQKRKIFEPFYSDKNSNYNWGMGLTYVRSIVKSHFGVLRVESRLGQGSSFFIQLPKYDVAEGKSDAHSNSDC